MTMWLAIEPQRVTHQSALRVLKNKKTGAMFVGKTSKSGANKYKAEIIEKMKAQIPILEQQGFKLPISVPMKVGLMVNFLAPKCRASLYKKDPNLHLPMTVKPDWDNIAKIPFDCLVEAGIIKDDNLIFCGEVTKYEVAPDGTPSMHFFIHTNLP
jgi:Holliday junction resolvase RusA-like endonuclease